MNLPWLFILSAVSYLSVLLMCLEILFPFPSPCIEPRSESSVSAIGVLHVRAIVDRLAEVQGGEDGFRVVNMTT